MTAQKLERSFPVYRVWPIEELNLSSLRKTHSGVVKPADLCILVCHPFIRRYTVLVATFYHEWARRHQVRQVGIVHHVRKIEFEHVVLAGQKIAVAGFDTCVLPDPFVEVRRADRKCIAIKKRWHANSGLPSIGKTVETDSRRIDKGQACEPFQRSLMLSENKRKQRKLERVALPLDHAEAILSNVRILRGVSDKALLRQANSKTMIILRLDFRIGYILRSPLQAVLANDYRSALPRLKVLRHNQNAIGNDIGPDIQHHLI